MNFWRFRSNLISKSNSSFCFNRRPTRGGLWFAGTGSAGSTIWAVGFKGEWTHQIWGYLFVKWSNHNLRVQIRRLQKKRREMLTVRLGFRRTPAAAARWWLSATFQELPKLVDGWTACRTLRRARMREPRCQSRPGKEEMGGWNSALAQVTFGRGRLRCSAADTTEKIFREERQRKRGERGENRRRGVHRRRWIRPGMLAEAVDSGEKSFCGSSTISWRSKGRWRRSVRGLYSCG
jgi:hypothetical protein